MFKNKRGIVLIISIAIMAVVLVLVAAYFSNLLTEKRAADTEKFVLQRLNLAEAGASHALAELNKRITSGTDSTQNPPRILGLKGRVENEKQSSTFMNYVTANNSLGFLHDFAYGQGETQFSVASGVASLTVSSNSLYADNRYNYSATIIVEANGTPTNPSSDVYVFPFKYKIDSQGTINGILASKSIGLLQGEFDVTVRRDNFAKYALFTSHHNTPSGGTVWFTEMTNFTGPVHTNDRFNFANNPSAHFTDEVTQHQNKAGFYNNGWSRLLNADSNPPYDVPVFDAGFQRGYDEITLPSTVSQADLKKEAMGRTTDTFTNGIHVPNDGTNVTGGIYIKGNSGQSSDDPTILMQSATDGPVYRIKQGSGAETVVTVDLTNNTTTVGAQVYQGIPDGTTQTGGILIYTNDNLGNSSFGGVSGVVQSNSSVTVSSEKDIVIKGHLTYEVDPTTPGNEDVNNLLGLLSWGGDVRIGTSAPNDINIDAVVMAPHGEFTVDNYATRAPSGVVNLFGGSITDFYGAFGRFSGTNLISGYGRNFVYDERMLAGKAPPYFPYMANFTSIITPQESFLSRKLIWQDK